MKSGIYIIKNVKSNKVYIGQSVDLHRRIIHHMRNLEKGTHKNTYLQRSYNRDGKDAFCIEIIEYCDVDKLDERERYWISRYNSNMRDNGYNIESGGHEGHTWNNDARERRSGVGNPMYGKHHTKEIVERIRTCNRASSDKLTEQDVKEIKKALANGIRQKILSDKYDVAISTINKISRCENWEWVSPELNDKIINIENERKSRRDKMIIDMYNNGTTMHDISKKLRINPQTTRNVLGNLVDKSNANHEQMIRNVINDYNKGIPKDKIIAKYHISKTSYTRYTSKAFNEKKQKLIHECQKLRNDGMLVKDIAQKLGIHRTTVTEYCKMNYGNTESV